MRIKNEKDFWSGAMFIAIGIGFAWGATNYTFGSSARPGPGYFPFGLGLLLAVLGAMVLFKSLSVETDGGGRIGGVAWRPLLIVVGSVALFGFLLPRLGMIASLPLLVLTVALAGDEFHLGEALLNGAVLIAGCWAVFVYGLNLTIPLWPAFLQ